LTAAALLLTALTSGLVGCRSRSQLVREGFKQKVQEHLDKARKDPAASSIKVTGNKNSFVVDDALGNHILEAKVDQVDGAMRPDKGIDGPILMHKAKCLLYQKGKPQMHLDAPEATWDGERLIANKTAHGKTAEGDMVVDSRTAIWTSGTGVLLMDDAKMQSLKQGKITFNADAPKAEVKGQWVTMPAGAVGHNPDGQKLKANHVRLFRDTGKLEARGDVVVTDGETTVSGQRLQADTRLKKGRFSGATRVMAKSGKLPLAQNRNH
jgi:hypothetical protein